jgi:nitrate reductase alpha subunit
VQPSRRLQSRSLEVSSQPPVIRFRPTPSNLVTSRPIASHRVPLSLIASYLAQSRPNLVPISSLQGRVAGVFETNAYLSDRASRQAEVHDGYMTVT